MEDFTKNPEALIATAAELFKIKGSRIELEILCSSKLKIAQTRYDNWDGGIDFYTIYLEVPQSIYLSILDNKDQIEKSILETLCKIVPIGSDYVEHIVISPIIIFNPKWRDMMMTNDLLEDVRKEITNYIAAEYVTKQINNMQSNINSDPEVSIGLSKELIETICKTILKNRNISYMDDWDLPKILKLTTKELQLAPEDIKDTKKASETIKKILGSFTTIVQGISELRNDYGSGHGKEARYKGLTPRHAKLCVGAATILAIFLLETNQVR